MQRAKVVLIGNSSVGKTALFNRFETNEFNEDTSPTIGGACKNIDVTIDENGKQVPLVIWDTAGQESFRSIVPMYFSRAAFILIVYDISSKVSFEGVIDWYNAAKEKAPEDAKFILVGNKSDLADKREVSFEQMNELSESLNFFFDTETSAATGTGVNTLLTSIAATALKGMPASSDKAFIRETVSIEKQENEQKNEGCCG
ncbi:small GTP-binding protein [Histomonas meleagridis]|uniref:small GTP-binding protein n=1 Tax=Histomonas meleagridis TaxID=135588 RepID=UPI00355A91CE|nr:small GTP-binding protein [Histomonas meleagridis]KAH0801224.1 small GTP-binding protein [Histomonas meleagridis]